MKKRNMALAAAAVILLSVSMPSFQHGNSPALRGNAVNAQSLSAKSSADDFLKRNAAKYNLSNDLSGLDYVTTISTAAGSYVLISRW